MNRRDIIKPAGGIGAIASVWYGVDEAEWLRSISSKRPIQTEQRYMNGLPERTAGNDGRLLVELARTPEEAEQLFNYESISLPYRDQLRSGYDEGFWVAFATVQDYESSFHPGRWELRDGTLHYPTVNRLSEPSERDELFYHYEFHSFVLEGPLGTEPDDVSADWKGE